MKAVLKNEYGRGVLNPGRATSHQFDAELSIPLGVDDYDAVVAEAEAHRLPVGVLLRAYLGPILEQLRNRNRKEDIQESMESME